MPARPRLRTVAVALLLPLATAFTLADAQPVHAVPPPTPVKTLLTDIDGDRTYDTVQLFDLGSDSYRLTVTTTRGATSSVDFTSQLTSDMAAADVLYGAVTLDGTAGSELVVNLWDRQLLTYRDDRNLAVYTWRSGRLVVEKAPGATYISGWHMGITPLERAQGYRFFTGHGRRYVDVSDLKWKGNRYVGKATRSVWRKGAWKKVSTRRLTVKNGFLSPYLGYGGDPVLRGVARTDIDGDGAADELRYYRYVDDSNGGGRFKVKVTTATGEVVTRKLAAGEYDPLIGAAELDGAAGAELVFEIAPDDPDWRVLTWNSGRLVDEPAPAVCGGPAGGTWHGCSDETPDNITFSVVGGSHYAVFGTLVDDPARAIHYSTSVWQAGKWVKVSDTTDTNPGPTFTQGFFGVTFIKP